MLVRLMGACALAMALAAAQVLPVLEFVGQSWGWRLAIDDETAANFRAIRVMCGAAVPAGEHTQLYTYEPGSFRAGAIISTAGLIVLSILAWQSWRAPPAPPRVDA
jgi:hypothetical protein